MKYESGKAGDILVMTIAYVIVPIIGLLALYYFGLQIIAVVLSLIYAAFAIYVGVYAALHRFD